MIQINGLAEIQEKLENIAHPPVEAMGKACAAVEDLAKRKAPKVTGELRRSITSRVEVDDGEVRGIVFTPLKYAPYVEYGTGIFAESDGRTDVPWRYQDEKGNWHSTNGQHPKPFMRPALDESREDIIKILQEGLIND